jgi:hypothetical protein
MDNKIDISLIGRDVVESAVVEAPISEEIKKEVVSEPKVENVSLSEDELRNKILAELGVATFDEAKERISGKKVEVNEEDLAKNEAIRKLKVKEYAISKGLKESEINEAESVSSIEDLELVKADFAKNVKAKNGALTDREIEDLFYAKYQVDSNNETLKELAESSLKTKASIIRDSKLSKFSNIEKEYNSNLEMDKKYNDFDKKVASRISEFVADAQDFEIEVDGEKIAIPFNIKEFKDGIVAEITKSKDIFFNDYVTDGEEKSVEKLKSFSNSMLQLQMLNNKVKNAYLAGLANGVKKAAVGARAPFPLNEQVNKEGISRAEMINQIGR